MRHTHHPALGLLALAVAGALTLSACSIAEVAPQATDAAASPTQAPRSQADAQKAVAQRHADLPRPTAGLVEVDGTTGDSLTGTAYRSYRSSGGTTNLSLSDNGEDSAYAALCAGEIDLVDSTREISREEWEACRRVGLDVVQLAVAADAVVLAIRSETDIGGDCLSTDQVREVFRAGSPLINWSQLGFDDERLEVGGPGAGDSSFTFFGRHVLESPTPGITNVRSDYKGFSGDTLTRRFVVGDPRDERVAASFGFREDKRNQLKESLEGWWQAWEDAEAEVQEALGERRKGILDNRPETDRARDEARVQAAYEQRSSVIDARNAAKVRYDRAQERYLRTRDAFERTEAVRGNLGFFRFSYYEFFEDQLRPFEITLPTGERNCIFPSQRTIASGEYPLARRLLLTTTTRSLERDEVASFLRSYLRSAGSIAEDQRLMPVPAATIREQVTWLDGAAAPVLYTPDAQSELVAGEQPAEPAEKPVR